MRARARKPARSSPSFISILKFNPPLHDFGAAALGQPQRQTPGPLACLLVSFLLCYLSNSNQELAIIATIVFMHLKPPLTSTYPCRHGELRPSATRMSNLLDHAKFLPNKLSSAPLLLCIYTFPFFLSLFVGIDVCRAHCPCHHDSARVP